MCIYVEQHVKLCKVITMTIAHRTRYNAKRDTPREREREREERTDGREENTIEWKGMRKTNRAKGKY